MYKLIKERLFRRIDAFPLIHKKNLISWYNFSKNYINCDFFGIKTEKDEELWISWAKSTQIYDIFETDIPYNLCKFQAYKAINMIPLFF